jgi:transposase
MEKVPVFVGLDYHQSSVQVCVMDTEGRELGNRRCGNSVVEVAFYAESFGSVQRAAIEACCGAADMSQSLTEEAGWNVRLAHPGSVRRMKLGPDKSDYTDAKMLAELCRVNMIPPVWLAPESIRELRSICRFRHELVRSRTMLKNRILAMLRERRVKLPPGRRWTVAFRQWLGDLRELGEHARWLLDQHLEELGRFEQRIRQAEKRLDQATQNDPVVARLRELPGIGPVTAWTMRAEVGDFTRFRNGRQLARFCGLTPRNASSGQRQADAGLVKGANPDLKTVLVQAAHRLTRLNPRYRRMAHSMLRRGKPVNVTVAAVANRWVRWLYYQMTERSPTLAPARAA